jgi:hypothetical protein
VTLVLISLLGAIFVKGFREAIGIAVVLVAIYLVLNSITIGVGLYEVFNPSFASEQLANRRFRNKNFRRLDRFRGSHRPFVDRIS